MKTRPWASLALGLALVGALSACSVFTLPTTQRPYDASDGVSVHVGDVRLLNVIVFTEDGEDGNFSAGAVNTSDRDVELTLQYESDGERVDVVVDIPAGTTFNLGGDGDQVFLPGIGVMPGGLLKVYVQYGSNPGKQIDVPVLDTSLPEYDGLLPTPTPTPTPTETAAPEPTETPAP